MYNFEALDEKDRQNMLISIGVESIDEIFDIIPWGLNSTSNIP